MTAVMVGWPIVFRAPNIWSVFVPRCVMQDQRGCSLLCRLTGWVHPGSPGVPWPREGPMSRPLPGDQRRPPGSGLPAEACLLSGGDALHSRDRAVGVQLGAGVEVAEARSRTRLLAGPRQCADRCHAERGHLAGELP